MLAIFLQIVDTPQEQTKFEKLYHRYKNLLFYVAYNALEDYEDAEDAVNETFFRVAKNFSKIGEIECHETRNFLVIIIKNISIDLLRKRKAFTGELNEEQPVRGYAGTDENTPEKLRDVVDVLKEMPANYRDVVWLIGVAGYRAVEIAAFLGVSPETIRKRLHRGREMLKKRLGE